MDQAVARARLAAAPVARLATVDGAGRPGLVPCCFVLAGDLVYTAVDAKPKTTTALRRLADIDATGRACLLVDHYDDDWTALWWVRADARGALVEDGGERRRALDLLAAKYAQYREAPPPGPVLRLEVTGLRSWEATPATAPATGPAGTGPEDVVVQTAHGLSLATGALRPGERAALYSLFAGVVARREGFPQQDPLTPEEFAAAWERPTVVAARYAEGLVGAYYLRPNFVGRASHIANAGYVVAPSARGRGVGRALVEDSIRRAPALGFSAIQFNLVFAGNPARRLYQSLGWREIGRVPEAVDGEDAVIYWRRVG